MEPLYNEVLGITNDILRPSNSKIHGKYLDITKPRFSERILPVPWPLVISRFYCTTITLENIKFMLHVPLHITKVTDVGEVSLWVSSVCWDTK